VTECIREILDPRVVRLELPVDGDSDRVHGVVDVVNPSLVGAVVDGASVRLDLPVRRPGLRDARQPQVDGLIVHEEFPCEILARGEEETLLETLRAIGPSA
jgi:hypothetical protein